jgi:CHAT domain-containing protein
VTLSRTAGDRVAEARGLFGVARAAMGRHDLDAARHNIERSLKVVESLRTEVENRDLRASYFASVYRYHEFYVEVLMRLHKARPSRGLSAAAFEVSERARARSLLESLAEAGVDLRAGVDPDLLGREQVLNRAFEDWAKRRTRLAHGQPAKADDRSLAREYQQLEEHYREVQSEIRIRSPRYAALVRPQPLSLEALRAHVLDANTVLLEYALGEQRSYLWAVGKTEHAVYELPSQAEIERLAQRVSERLTARLTPAADERERHRRAERADAEFWTEAARLSDLLLAPVARTITGKRIVIVADGALQYVPFGALPAPGTRGEPVPMLVQHEIVSVPSASVLAALQRPRSGPPPAGTIAVLADPVFEADDPRLGAARARPARSGGFPRLAATRREAESIVATAPRGTTRRALDFAASRATALHPDLGGFRIVHFATHGVFDNESPGLSGIVLSMFDQEGRSRDGFLRLRDIYGLNLSADLVVLSACNTALGKQVRGEGLVGIVRGFMHSGARRVVATLWKVDDEATAEIMSIFYREMLAEGRSPAAALREAQLAMWRQPRWRSPFYWAAFVLQGDWT